MNGYPHTRVRAAIGSTASLLAAALLLAPLSAEAQYYGRGGGQPSVEINMDALSGLRGPYSPPPGGAQPLNRGRSAVNAPRMADDDAPAKPRKSKTTRTAKASAGQETVIFSHDGPVSKTGKLGAQTPPAPPMMATNPSTLPPVDLPLASMPEMPMAAPPAPPVAAPQMTASVAASPPPPAGSPPLPPLDMLTQIDKHPGELPPLGDIPPALPLPPLKDSGAQGVKVTVKREAMPPELPEALPDFPPVMEAAPPLPPPAKEVAKAQPPAEPSLPPIPEPSLDELMPMPEPPMPKDQSAKIEVLPPKTPAPKEEEPGLFGGLSKRLTNLVTDEKPPSSPVSSAPSKLDELMASPPPQGKTEPIMMPEPPPPDLAKPGLPELPPMTPLLAEEAPPAPLPPKEEKTAALQVPPLEPMPPIATDAAPAEPRVLAPIDVGAEASPDAVDLAPPPVPDMPMPEIVPPKETASLEQPDKPVAAPGGPVPDMQIVYNVQETEVPLSLKDKLSGLAGKIKKDDNLRLTIVSYAAGTEQQSSTARRVSLARALAIRSYLIEQGGIDSLRINVQSMGNKNPGGPDERADIFLIKG